MSRRGAILNSEPPRSGSWLITAETVNLRLPSCRRAPTSMPRSPSRRGSGPGRAGRGYGLRDVVGREARGRDPQFAAQRITAAHRLHVGELIALAGDGHTEKRLRLRGTQRRVARRGQPFGAWWLFGC